MTDYTELKRLAEAATAGKWESAETRVYFPFVAGGFDIRNAPNAQHNAAYIAAASPDVTLEMIDALDVQAGSIEAVQAANQRLAAERDKLRTQNQALVEALKTGLEYVEECLIYYDQSYADHPATKAGRGIIKSDIDAINAALAQAEGGV